MDARSQSGGSFTGFATSRGGRIPVLVFGVLGLFTSLIGGVSVLQGKDTATVLLAGLGLLGLGLGSYFALRSKFQLTHDDAGKHFVIGSTKLGPNPQWSATVCAGTTRNTRGREVGKHPVLQVVLYDADQKPAVKLTETRNMFQRAPVEWEWSDPIDADKHYGNIVGNIRLEQLVEHLSEG